MDSSTTSETPHVALLAFPFGTHAAPLLTLGRHLAQSAPDISFSFITTAQSSVSITAHITNCSHLHNLSFHNVGDGLPKGFVPSRGSPQEDIELFIKAGTENFQKVFAKLPKITCIISDCFLELAEKISEELAVPRIELWTSGAASLSIHLYTDLIREKVGICQVSPKNRDNQITCVPWGASFLRLKDLQEGVITGRLDSLFSRLLHAMNSHARGASAVILNSFDSLEPSVLSCLREFIPIPLNLGPFHLLTPVPTSPPTDSTGCLAFLDKHHHASVLYASFGTVAGFLFSSADILALAEGLESSGIPFIWSLMKQRHSDLPPGFVDRIKDNGKGMIVPWAPQQAILMHSSTSAFLTHCGWNSVLESITAGVPMACKPVFAEQGLNARMVVDGFKIGVMVEGSDAEAVKEAIGKVMGGDPEVRKRVGEYKKMAYEAMTPNGSSRKSVEVLIEMLRNVK